MAIYLARSGGAAGLAENVVNGTANYRMHNLVPLKFHAQFSAAPVARNAVR